MQTLFSSNRNLILASVALFFVIIATSYFYSKPKDEYIAVKPLTLVATSTAPVQNDIDSDGEGLKDWEEVLWKTDPHNPDTDGDGISDGAEVARGDDPLTKGKGVQSIGIATNTTPVPNAPLTRTEIFSRELFSRYMDAKQKGQTISSTTVEDFISNAVENTSAEPILEKQYTLSDLKHTKDELPQTLKNYGNALARALVTNKVPETSQELSILQVALQDQKPDELKKLAPIAKAYKTMALAALQVPVPPSIALSHLEFVNTLLSFSQYVSDFQLIFTDPIIGAAALSNYTGIEDRYVNAYRGIHSFFAIHTIIFNSSEYGYAFMQDI